MASIVSMRDGLGTSKCVIGEAFLGFESKIVPSGASNKMRDDCLSILGDCAINPGERSVTGLVVGQVQSGKTMSYEGLICMAHDNSIPVVVVVSGISTVLQDQGYDRLTADLHKAADRSWHFMKNPNMDDSNSYRVLESVARDWSDPDIPHGRRRTAVISVLKNHNHLNNLTEILSKISWNGWPALIIDDEADQASLNTRIRRPGNPSTTYSVLKQLRQVFDTFSYVQYTATPQAPLLISIADTLSPSFVRVLEPGNGYVGGETLFGTPTPYVAAIPAADLAAVSAPALEPPKSLVSAMRVFFLGLACAHQKQDVLEARSMLIHPSQGTDKHSTFSIWARRLKDKWWKIVNDREQAPEDFADLVEEFREARTELSKTVADIPPVENLATYLKMALSRTHVIEMNASKGKTPSVPWEDFDGFILVGGQALDRGFTVKGLTVTYMPRDPGIGNADTIQQRARFFGYKAAYLEFCRVYLESDLLEAFKNYVDHEIDIRRRLKSIQESGTRLSAWRRTFVLDPSLKPTRQSVQQIGSLQDQYSDEWYWDNRPSFDSAELTVARGVVGELGALGTFSYQKPATGGSDSHEYEVARDVRLDKVVNEISQVPVVDESNSLRFTGLLVQLERALEDNPTEPCDVYVIRPRTRTKRSLTPVGAISQVFQGPNQRTSKWKQGELYPGDRNIIDKDKVSVQVHVVDVVVGDELVQQSVPIVAIWVPSRLATGWLVQKGQ